MGPLLLAWIASLLILVVIKDLGTSLLFFGIFLALLYVATERASWVVIGLLLFAAQRRASATTRSATCGSASTSGCTRSRPSEISGNAYQLVQGLFGLANGGLLGTGLGRGRPDVVPSAWNDFILSSLGEEIGAVGVMAILVLYFLLVARGLRAALGVRDGFGKLLAAGIGTAIRHSGLRRGRRGAAGDPADRPDLALRGVRRQQPGRQRDPDRPAAAHQRRRPAAPAGSERCGPAL